MPELAIDLTQWVGVAVFAVAAVTCLAAARKRPLPWRVLAAVQVASCFEVAAGLRYLAHNAVDFSLQAHGRYEGRHPAQLLLASATLLVAGVCVIAIAGRRRHLGGSAVGALIGTALTATLFGIETISMHEIDAALYAMAGPIKVIGWLWVVVAAITAGSALYAALASRRER